MSNGLIRGEPVDDDLYSIQIEGDFDASMRDVGIAVTEAALDESSRGRSWSTSSAARSSTRRRSR